VKLNRFPMLSQDQRIKLWQRRIIFRLQVMLALGILRR